MNNRFWLLEGPPQVLLPVVGIPRCCCLNNAERAELAARAAQPHLSLSAQDKLPRDSACEAGLVDRRKLLVCGEKLDLRLLPQDSPYMRPYLSLYAALDTCLPEIWPCHRQEVGTANQYGHSKISPSVVFMRPRSQKSAIKGIDFPPCQISPPPACMFISENRSI